ncbi:DUF4123 domain-containing protein [Vibrio cholerae]|uniref:DUF4123 domain-containing protein n=1 Tax=Vibrio cholerae TaxID=666 RepID=A0A023PRD4_VIBCL|nr:DUF4123 domain-containing protein [Vibrio cholerae]AHX36785.1 hypothetical protein [Vibrio cholerae]EGQ7785170.1 DUF4123 domain-containing protein [Vibrio cholerae]EGQ9890808.1 DUF4123 domain-containing protein [Vibrio cholerae]EGR1419061.1 DUF4123 domain-containing protein [Vibrio cholerae]EGR2830375.1 DUF4123 domain-containing protein [Vibrio cholerae]
MKINEAQYLLVVDTLRIPDAKMQCAQENQTWEPLYLGTDWQPQLENSPIWVSVTPHDSLWQLWENDQTWATSAVLFAYSTRQDLHEIVKSLQNNITAPCEDGRLFLLRFYSPYTLSVIAKFGDEAVTNAVLGVAHSAYLSPLIIQDYGVNTIQHTRLNSQQTPLSLPRALIEELLQ